MSVLNWLRGAAGKVVGGINWLGQNIGKPILGFAKNLPVVGEVVRAAEPALNAISKTSQWAQDALEGVPAAKRRKLPTGEEFKAGINSAISTGKSIAGLKAQAAAM